MLEKARPSDGVLAFLKVLHSGAAMVLESHHPLGAPRGVGHDEANARIQISEMQQDFATARRGLVRDLAW